ncbi:MAG: transposase, partial [Bacteroidales bacterium]|nr:transposase [Bacteroidales bacterium]
RIKMWDEYFLPNRDSSEPIIIDVDSTVKTSYGNQEGAIKGFNSSKKGAVSFHPQLAFCAETKEILQGWYRCGNAYTSNGIVEFMQQLTVKLPSTEQFYFRADSGYFSDKLLSYLEDNGYLYLIKVKMKNLVPMLENQIWSDIKDRPGWQESTFEYKCSNW